MLLAKFHKQQKLAEHSYFLLTGYCSLATSAEYNCDYSGLQASAMTEVKIAKLRKKKTQQKKTTSPGFLSRNRDPGLIHTFLPLQNWWTRDPESRKHRHDLISTLLPAPLPVCKAHSEGPRCPKRPGKTWGRMSIPPQHFLGRRATWEEGKEVGEGSILSLLCLFLPNRAGCFAKGMLLPWHWLWTESLIKRSQPSRGRREGR